MEKMNRPVAGVIKEYKRLMEDAGFLDVVEVVHKWPTNQWPKDPDMKELGMWNLENLLQGLQGGYYSSFNSGTWLDC